nr:NAD(P)-binding domain-containing protein [Kibdelosporangium phytohabitans]
MGFIGCGMLGGSIARLAVASGLDVVLSNSRGPGTLAGLVADLGDRARAATVAQAAQAADIVVLSTPMRAYSTLPATALAGKTVLDTTNYYPDLDGRIAELDNGLTTSGLVQQHLADSFVVKGCNNIVFHHLGALARPAGAADRSALPIAGDHPAAKAAVTDLLDLLGYDTVDIGTLADSWRSERDTPVYGTPYMPEIPTGLSDMETGEWIITSPAVPVPAQRVAALVRSAVRDDTNVYG